MVENNNQLPAYNHGPMEAPHYPFSLEGHWQPWYDDRRDYNTNAPTYYDYLANFNKVIADIVELLNRVARRNIQVEDTNCVDLTKINDWIEEDNSCKTWHDVITLKADVILSTYKRAIDFDGTKYELENIIECLSTGLYAEDYKPLLDHLKDKLNKEITDRTNGDNNLQQQITNLNNQLTTLKQQLGSYITSTNNRLNTLESNVTQLQSKVTTLESAIQKIVTNLYDGGNATTNNISTYQINNKIAAGNINLYGGTTDGNSLIRTHKGAVENDVTIGSKG